MTDINGTYADTSGMFRVHAFFRREFGAIPALVKGVAAGDADRVKVVADHIALLLTILHHHHEGQDAALWPRLLERAPAELSPMVHLMESQHEELAATIIEAEEALADWTASSSLDARDWVAGTLERLVTTINVHMEAEEKVLPLCEKYILASEWEQMISDGATALSPADMLLVAGMLIFEGGLEAVPEQFREALAEAAPAAYREHSQLVYGADSAPLPTR